MAEGALYFAHDTNSRYDPKIQKVIMKHGLLGYGIYWCLIEVLHEQNGYISKDDIESIAFSIRAELETVKSIINDFGLFKADDDGNIYSDRVLKNIQKRLEKSEKARRSVQARYQKATNVDQSNNEPTTNVDQSNNDRSTIKESKVNKEKDNKYPFENFWDLYPVKVGKKKCVEKWENLKDTDKAKVLDTLPGFIAYKPFDTFNHPNPLTYLNQERWNDELPQLSQVNNGQQKYTSPKQITIDHSTLN
ncbi:DUF4373 domain-containing protein [Sphingobacterium sp. DN00404]|uniref:DUF4373 domain-containing protein n=1 Tax=Sphingobacterium micropteri TaxID=2763501 RepID=A0ABR7YU96_9SPHI|nr:DUF4373 domain-containing protein [Sphingobacterium micropteri]MBD1434850.1 DUF4373 domain-containing protein [Sphingobacterium micropteri]